MRPHIIGYDNLYEGKDVSLKYSKVEWSQGDKRFILKFHDAGRVSRKRAFTLFEKEPTTITWLESFTDKDVLFDVGANVGMYSVYAAYVARCQVIAFEPEALNYAELNKNVFLNNLYDRVKAYCCAVADKFCLDQLFSHAFAPAYSHHDFGENRWEGQVTNIAASKESRPRQGCISIDLDWAVNMKHVPKPTHVKIDVDGFEWKVVDGAWDVINAPSTKSVLIETDFKLKDNVAIMDRMLAEGWRFSDAQVCTDRDGRITRAEWDRRMKAGKGGCNIIYFRDPEFAKIFGD